MLEENRIATESGIEEAQMKNTFQDNERKGDGDNRVARMKIMLVP